MCGNFINEKKRKYSNNVHHKHNAEDLKYEKKIMLSFNPKTSSLFRNS